MEETNELPKIFLNKIKAQYNESDVNRIIEGCYKKRKVSLRINTIKMDGDKIKDILLKNNISFDVVKWNKNALIINNCEEQEIKEMDIYKNGEIYLQSLSSMLPPIILSPKEGKDILDMCAAPGGKTSQMAELTQNKAHITACEMNKIRAERLKYNLEKLGVQGTTVLITDSRRLSNYFSFDQILLDSPCSGSGTIEIGNLKSFEGFSDKLIEKSVKSQKELIKKAVTLLKKGQTMVYSTCSIIKEENEDIINSILKEKQVEIDEINFDGIESIAKLPCNIPGTLCVCPTDEYEGFFVAKLKKV